MPSLSQQLVVVFCFCRAFHDNFRLINHTLILWSISVVNKTHGLGHQGRNLNGTLAEKKVNFQSIPNSFL